MLNTRLTPALLEQAKELRAQFMGWRVIAKKLQVSDYMLRCELEPEYRDRRRFLAKRRQEQQYQKHQHETIPRRPHRKSIASNRTEAHVAERRALRPPPEVLAERDLRLELMLQPRSLTAELLGDPICGRSALDQRGKK